MKSNAQLLQELDAVIARVPHGSFWRHVKSGCVYRVVDYCFLEETAAPAVMYAKHEKNAPVWARDAALFMDGRFVKAEDEG
jgi:hypothetical protein